MERTEWGVDDCWEDHIAQLVNKNLDFVPEYSPHSDFTEAEGAGQNLISTNQDWMYREISSGEKIAPMTALTVRQQKIASWWKDKQLADSIITPFVLNWIDSRSVAGDWDADYLIAREYLCKHGTERDRLTAQELLSSSRGGEISTVVGRRRSLMRWGGSISLSDCWIVELEVGNLHFHIVEYVGAIHLPETLHGFLNAG